MSRYLSAFAILLISFAAFAQTTATAPTTKPTLPVINCPDVEAIIASIPADLWPKPGLSGSEVIKQGNEFNAWSKQYAKGKNVDFSAVVPIMSKRSGTLGSTAKFTSKSRGGVTVLLTTFTNEDTTNLKVSQVSASNSHGRFTVSIALR